MDTNHPIASPAGGNDTSGHGPVTPLMVEYLQRTRPWVLFISILGFVAAGFMVLGGLVMFAVGSFLPEMGPAGGIVIGLIYLVVALIYGFISIQLFRYSKAIEGIPESRDGRAIEQALDHQRAFWRLVGIICIAYLALMVLLFVFGILAALILPGLLSTGA